MLLRIEDIDPTRCRPEFEEAIYEDLAWLGLTWPSPVWRQSERSLEYLRAIQRLVGMGLLYPCFCTRAESKREVAAAADAPHGPDGPLYPGTCRALSADEPERRADEPHAWRLDITDDKRVQRRFRIRPNSVGRQHPFTLWAATAA